MATDLLAELDAAAAAILAAANPKEGDEPVSLQDRIKAFQVVGQYAQMREKLAPPQPKTTQGSKFDGLKSAFHGETRSRGGRPKTKTANGASALDTGDDDSAAGADDPLSAAPTH